MTRPPVNSHAGQEVIHLPGQTVSHSSEYQEYDAEPIDSDRLPTIAPDASSALPSSSMTVENNEPIFRPLDRRPIVPRWMRNAEQCNAFFRWLAVYLWHTTAFHTLRIPKYVLRAVVYSPRGIGRAIVELYRWVSDAEGRPLRLHAIERGGTGGRRWGVHLLRHPLYGAGWRSLRGGWGGFIVGELDIHRSPGIPGDVAS